VVADWEFYDGAKNNASEEAPLLVPLYRQTRVMDEVKGNEMRHLIRSYAEHVVHGWEAFSHGERNTAAGADTNEIIRESLSPMMWMGIILGGVITIGFTFILYMDRCWPHAVGVAVMSAVIGMLLFVAAMFSRPFHGPLAIEPAPFEQVLAVFDQVDKGQ
jgi:hypothetical protein